PSCLLQAIRAQALWPRLGIAAQRVRAQGEYARFMVLINGALAEAPFWGIVADGGPLARMQNADSCAPRPGRVSNMTLVSGRSLRSATDLKKPSLSARGHRTFCGNASLGRIQA